MLKGGIIGFGNVVINGHLPGWRGRKDAHISAVMDVDPSRKKECARLLPDAIFYNSVEEMLESEQFDFIDIATPPSTHAPLIKKCLEKNLHILCEKPLVLSSDDFESIAQLARQKDRVLFTVHNWRHSPMIKAMFRMVEQGKIGKLEKLTWQVLRTKPSVALPSPGESHSDNNITNNWRLNPKIAGGGILIDHGWHAFYIIMELFGSIPTHTRGVLENRKYKDLKIEDTATVSIFFPEGQAEAMFTWHADERKNRVEIKGSCGELVLEHDYIDLTTSSNKEKVTFSQSISQGSHHPEWFGSTVHEFFTEIREADKKGKNLNQAAACLAIVESCWNSNNQNGTHTPIFHPETHLI